MVKIVKEGAELVTGPGGSPGEEEAGDHIPHWPQGGQAPGRKGDKWLA